MEMIRYWAAEYHYKVQVCYGMKQIRTYLIYLICLMVWLSCTDIPHIWFGFTISKIKSDHHAIILEKRDQWISNTISISRPRFNCGLQFQSLFPQWYAAKSDIQLSMGIMSLHNIAYAIAESKIALFAGATHPSRFVDCLVIRPFQYDSIMPITGGQKEESSLSDLAVSEKGGPHLFILQRSWWLLRDECFFKNIFDVLKLYYIYIKTTNNFLTNSLKNPYPGHVWSLFFFSFPKDGHPRPSATWPPGPAAKRRGRTVGRNPSGWGLGEAATTVGRNGWTPLNATLSRS